MGKARPESICVKMRQFDASLVGTSTFGRLRSGARTVYFTVKTFEIVCIVILCTNTCYRNIM